MQSIASRLDDDLGIRPVPHLTPLGGFTDLKEVSRVFIFSPTIFDYFL
ncbi:MAG: hypothetical protein AAFR89_13270 [Cyanobacteria bacterium J06633_1]